MYSTRYSCQILMKLEFPRQLFEKFSDIIFHKNPSYGRRKDGQTDRHDEAKSHFSQFCERTYMVYFSCKYKFTNIVTTVLIKPI